MFWALIVIVGLKYLYFVTRADNHGEGGLRIAGADHARDRNTQGRLGGRLLILIGAALLYGDGIITPAISVSGGQR